MRTSKTPEPGKSPLESRVAHHSSQSILPTAPLPEHIAQNIDAIVAIHTRAERDVPRHQQVVEAVTTFLGRPAFLYCSLLVVALWLLPNVLPQSLGLPQFDPFPSDLLQLTLGIISLPMTIAVLIKQERQEKLAEQRAQLSLQLNLLSEQKIAKLIALAEELRRDLPNVKDRYDSEADVLKQAADPHMLMNTLEQRLEEELVALQGQEKFVEPPS